MQGGVGEEIGVLERREEEEEEERREAGGEGEY